MSEILEKISTVVIEGDLDEIVDLTEDALDEGLSAQEILDRLIAMKENAFFIGEVVERKGAHERVQWV